MTIQEWLGSDNQLGIDIWEKKYRRNNESFNDWLNRVSGGDIYVRQLIEEKKFLFGGRILSNRGVDSAEERTTYSNCYVISPPEDSIESIYDTCKKLARTYSYGGGCGVDISKLAPAGAKVHNQAKSTSGAVSFMDTFSHVTEQIGQNGRRGALMISLDCSHPDLEKFITVKSDLGKVTSANISVRVSDKFMEAVENDADWELSFTRKETGETISKTVKAKDIFELLCKNNWNYAEPGILFWDRITDYNLLSNNPKFQYAGTNPCAEEPLPAGGSCLLGALNLSEFVSTTGDFCFDLFEKSVHIAVKALNDVLDEGLPKHPLQEQRDSVSTWRQIGLGIMGLADMLIKMNIRYGSKEAVTICDEIGRLLASSALKASNTLATEQKSYAECMENAIIKTPFFKENGNRELKELIKETGLRNSQLLTIAPTGTISTMFGVSGGIEPIFANSYTRITKSLHGHDEAYKVYTPIVKAYMDANGLEDDSELPEWFVTSADLSVEERIDMQSVWQKHIDASISSTVNLPNEATVEDVKEIYMSAWKKGLKGITIYRAGCAREGILTVTPEDEGKEEKGVVFDSIIPVSRKTMGTTHGSTYCKKCACGTLYITLNRDSAGNIVESFIHTSKGGICQANTTAVNRMVSLALRSGVKVNEIIDQLKGLHCPACANATAKGSKLDGMSCPDILARTLEDFATPEFLRKNMNIKSEEIEEPTCPECGHPVIHDGGCVVCQNCGWSKCV